MSNEIQAINTNNKIPPTKMNRSQYQFIRALDDFIYGGSLSPYKKHIKATASQLWQEMKMPKELLPLIDFNLNPRHALGGANPIAATLSFPQNDDVLRIVMAMDGGEKAF